MLIDSLLDGPASTCLRRRDQHLILPAIALGSIPLAIITRITRASVLDVNNEDYVRTARAKGLREKRVDARHVMRNAWLPVVTVLGLPGRRPARRRGASPRRCSPGPASAATSSTRSATATTSSSRSSILIFAVIFLVVNLLVDLMYAFLNPRIRYCLMAAA